MHYFVKLDMARSYGEYAFGRHLPPNVMSRIRSSLARQVREDFRRFRAYASTRRQASINYHSIRRMIANGHYQRAAYYMRFNGVPSINATEGYP